MSNLRDKILASTDLEEELVDVPQWGVKLLVRAMNGRERAAMLRASMTSDGDINYDVMYPLIIIATTFDPETGDRVFTDRDVEALNEKSGGALERIAKVATRLSGLGKDEVSGLGKPSSQDTNGSIESDVSLST